MKIIAGSIARRRPATACLTTTCFEFWDDYNKGANGRKVTIRLALGPNDTLRIDGKPYLLCKRKSELPRKQ